MNRRTGTTSARVARHGGTRRQDHQAGVPAMPISSHEDWVQIAELDDQDQIRFTAEFRALMSDLGWEAKAFVGHLLGLWYDPFEHMLDYTSGEATCTQDQPGEFDRNGIDEPQDVDAVAVELARLVLGAGCLTACVIQHVLERVVPQAQQVSDERLRLPAQITHECPKLG